MAVVIKAEISAKTVGDYPIPYSETAETIIDTSDYYSWDSCPHTWDAMGGKTWDTAGNIAYTLDADAGVAFVEKAYRTQGKRTAETLRYSESRRKAIGKTSKEAIGIAEKRSVMLWRLWQKSVSVADALSNKLRKQIKRQMSITDGSTRGIVANNAESIAFAETYWDVILFLLKVCENIALAEVDSNAVKKSPFKESFGVSERKVLKKPYKKAFDSMALLDRISKATSQANKERFAVTDKEKNVVGVGKGEALGVADSIAKTLGQLVADHVKLQDGFRQSAGWQRLYKEAVRLSDRERNTARAYKYESLRVTDTVKKIVGHSLYDAFAFADVLKRCYDAKRSFAENASFSERLYKTLRLLKKETPQFYDTLIRACEGVLSNIYAAQGEMSLEGFLQAVDTPSGYTAFTDFKVGEYEYQEALARAIIKASVPQSEPSVSDMVMHVDIPDTDDRGTVEIEDTSAATKVYYNKHYYNPPEVNAIVIGGNTGDGLLRPNLLCTDGLDDGGRYFEIEIINASGQRAAGVISWVSKGY